MALRVCVEEEVTSCLPTCLAHDSAAATESERE